MASLSRSGAAAQRKGEWPTIPPADAGLDPRLADRLDAAFAAGRLAGLHGVVIARRDGVAVERYYRGRDQRWGADLGVVEHAADSLHDLRSISKSVVALLYGVALDDGLVPAVDAPLLEQFPGYADLPDAAAKRAITIEHALTMTLGLEWSEDLPYSDPRNSEIAMELAADRYRFVLAQKPVDPPGARWRYSGGATALLAKIIADGTGRTLPDFARERLFAPLGVDAFEWVAGADGVAAAASGLRLRPRDLARIGQLVADRGEWRGQRLVSAEWIEAMLTPRADTGDLAYGYQWWLDPPAAGGRWVAGFGNGGQRLWIGTRSGLIVVVTAGRYNDPEAWRLPVAVLTDYVLPAFRG